jgi:sulfate transport system substrate-binding protein
VTVVDKNATKKGNLAVAQAYLNFLYTPAAQDIIAKSYYRPVDPAAAAKYRSQFKEIKLYSIDKDFGGWKKAQAQHFADGGVFDQIYQPGK